jgi:hypothetical protein
MMLSSSKLMWAQYGPFSGVNPNTGAIIGPGADFVQCYNLSTGDYYDRYTSNSTVGNSPTFRIHYGTDPDGQSGNKIFVKDGTIDDWCGGDNGHDPFTFTPVKAQVADEIHDIETQLPGSVSTHETFTSATVTDPNSGASDFFSRGGFTFTNQRTWMGLQRLTSTHVDLWDKDCP